uniref:RNA polymerase subunit H/Rpb5 C-terminal domain-containing protein n=1 Tax=viral metagenome TaxID=1070528 RepID=A0A6C0EM85_9ZZZZ
MSTSYSPIISKVYKSRIILLEILKARGFDTDDWGGFSVTEIETLYNNKQLDMLLENPTTNKKIFIKYHLATRLGPVHVYDYVDDLFDIEDVLTTYDDLIIISKDKVNTTIQDLIEQSFIKDKRFVNIYNLNDYLFNILNHIMVPPHLILDDTEKKKVEQRYNVTNDSEFPEISRFDPVAKAIGLRPGELCEITRSSPTAVQTKYYRLCY